MEKKGYMCHEVEGRTCRYRSTEPQHNVAAQALKQIIDGLCGGSVEQLLVDMLDNRYISILPVRAFC